MDIAESSHHWYNDGTYTQSIMMFFQKRLAGMPTAFAGLLVVAALVSVSSTAFFVAQLVDDTAQTSDETETEDAGAAIRRGVKPGRIDKQERDALERENDLREEVGRSIEQMREAEADKFAGDRMSFDELKERAIQKLGQDVAILYAEKEESDARQLGCFDAAGNVTNDRSQCAQSQSSFFGLTSEEGPGVDAFGDDIDALSRDVDALVNEADRAYGRPGDDELMEYGNRSYQPQTMRPQHDEFDPRAEMAGASPEMLTQMMDMMGKMMQKFPKLFAIFEREGIEIPKKARDVADGVVATYNRLSD